MAVASIIAIKVVRSAEIKMIIIFGFNNTLSEIDGNCSVTLGEICEAI